jgi:mannose-6-phosphate isomerase-like protein (cupin superfamily)
MYTGKFQLVLMSLDINVEIGMEIHKVDQFFRIEKGKGQLIIINPNNTDYQMVYDISDGISMTIPAGTQHNIKNVGNEALKLYTIYSEPIHLNGLTEFIKPN